ncbi:hypothetical protein C8R45DRAFT_1013533 [Mycena sanguinolenta]|nr:hypothetical protein C8R45DRAFT_1013533 [Mycena sanguinolenta]
MPSFQCFECGTLNTTDTERLEYEEPVSGTKHHILFNSNEAPLESEILTAKSETLKIDASLVSLDEEIVQLHLRLEQLEAERDRLSSYRARNSTILSPLRRMPPEILAEVFSLTVPTTVIPQRSQRYAPWFLTHVSRRWREIAVSTSSLWSLVVIDEEMVSAPAHPVPMLETQIARAKNLKIHFYGHSSFDSQRQAELFQYLAQYSSRWEELYLYPTSYPPWLANLRGRIPLLRFLWILWLQDPNEENTIDPPAEPIDFAESAPSLVDVSIINDFSPMPISLPAQQLTRYELRAPWEMHKAILARAPNLAEAHIGVRFRDESWPDTGAIIGLPALKSLFISHPEVLRYIWAPVLQELALSFESAHKLSIVAELETSSRAQHVFSIVFAFADAVIRTRQSPSSKASPHLLSSGLWSPLMMCSTKKT